MHVTIETASISTDRTYNDAFQTLIEASARLNATPTEDADDDNPVFVANLTAFRAAERNIVALIDSHTARAVAAAVTAAVNRERSVANAINGVFDQPLDGDSAA
jgi:hypothetical protein